MITKEDFKNLIELLDTVKVPENLEKFSEKIRIMYEEILYREEIQNKLRDIQERLNKIDEVKEEKEVE